MEAYMESIASDRLTETLYFLASQGWVGGPETFFQALARHLATTLNVEYVCIDRLTGDSKSARTLAVFHDGHFNDNETYTLADTPCGKVVEESLCIFKSRVTQLFPRDSVLQDLKAESYAGTILKDSRGSAVGLIAVIGRTPVADASRIQAILSLVAIRAAGELERMRTEEELEASEKKFRSFVENASDVIYTLDEKGYFTYLSPNWSKILGHDASRSLGCHYSEFVHPEDVADYERVLLSVFSRSPVSRSTEYRVRHSDTSWRWHASTVTVFTDESGKQIFLGISHDITEKKFTEKELAQKMAELKRWNEITLGREQRIMELKKEVNTLLVDHVKYFV